MPKNARDAGAKPSIHISKNDAENAEKLGWGDHSPSTAYSDALDDSVSLSEFSARAESLLTSRKTTIGQMMQLLEELADSDRR